MKSKSNRETIGSIISVVVAVTMTITFASNRSAFWTILFILIFGTIFLISYRAKHKLLLRLISVFGLIHFVMFPYIYIIFLNINSNSLLVNTNIVVNEKNAALKEINERYDPEQLNKDLLLIDSVISCDNLVLDSTLQYILDENMVIMDYYILHKSFDISLNGPPPIDYLSTIVVSNMAGKCIGEFSVDRYEPESKLRDVFLSLKRSINERLNNYSIRKTQYEQYQIWNYSRILWYSINIFDSKSIVPNTRGANVIYFIHRFFIYFLLALIGTTIYNSFFKAVKEKENK
jgi:hypothetical protein